MNSKINMKDAIINIYICLKAIVWIPARIVRYGFHLTSPKITFSQYIQGEKTKYGDPDLLNMMIV